MKSVLMLEDGTIFKGTSIGSENESTGEVVFNTCMTGYEEILTDPSYNGQMVTMTYPLIGNYGFNEDDVESYRAHAQGFIVKELCSAPSNWRNSISADEFMKRSNISGISGIDTRALTQHIRNFGSMWGIISSQTDDITDLSAKLKNASSKKRDLVMEVTTKTPIHKPGSGKKVVVMDYGVKYNILRSLEARNCDLIVLPADTASERILEFKPDGVVLSNGPGDPAELPEIVNNVKKLIGIKPILGICLGHQLLGRALGGNTYKLKFGHHGGNHPVKDFITNRVYITSQNHNYALSADFCADAEITHLNVNDRTVEGFRHKGHGILSVQYHPEASPGPKDSAYIFDDFVNML